MKKHKAQKSSVSRPPFILPPTAEEVPIQISDKTALLEEVKQAAVAAAVVFCISALISILSYLNWWAGFIPAVVFSFFLVCHAVMIIFINGVMLLVIRLFKEYLTINKKVSGVPPGVLHYAVGSIIVNLTLAGFTLFIIYQFYRWFF